MAASIAASTTATSPSGPAAWEWYLCAGAIKAASAFMLASFEATAAEPITKAVAAVVFPFLSTTVSF